MVATDRQWKMGAILVIVLLSAFAAMQSFVLDDAFISFRYAEHLAAGEGLVFNSGEWVEGYTNFLWTLWMSLAFVWGIEPVVFAHTTSLACFGFTCALVYRLAGHLFESRGLGLLVVLLAGTHYTSVAYATSGLETQLQTLFFVGAANLVLYAPRSLGLVSLTSIVFALALLNRLDSAWMVAVFGVYLLADLKRHKCSWKLYVAAILPGFLCFGPWLLWKALTYGAIFPNTYFAKVAGESSLSGGLVYLGLYFLSYGLVVWPPLALVKMKAIIRAPRFALLATLCMVWMLYIVLVGGDFMEFRFMAPIVPFLMILMTFLAVRTCSARWVSTLLVASIFLGSAAHAVWFKTTSGIESIADLEAHLTREVQDWEGVGKRLGHDLPEGSSVKIATTAAGAIPFYSKLPTLDLLGLTDADVARNGRVFRAQRSHSRMARPETMLSKGVNLVLGQPRIDLVRQRRVYMFQELKKLHVYPEGFKITQLPRTVRVLEIPLDARRVLMALYLKPHPDVDALVQSGKWRAFRLGMRRADETL